MKSIYLILVMLSSLHAQAPQLFLLKTYKNDMNVTGWVMSEKLDGVRAFWDGNKLISRSGKVFLVPKSFIKDFPPFALDGELWSRRGDFEHIVSIVNTKKSVRSWDELHYMVFEVPEQEGNFFERLEKLQTYLKHHTQTNIKVIEQIKIHSQEQVQSYFKKVTQEGAEGIVVRNPNVPYYTGRSQLALKFKPFIDAECRVLKHMKGKGKYKDKMGSLLCEYQGKEIKIGSGFSDVQRNSPPKIGTLISFKYYGKTALGNPKYPVFLRIRRDANLSLIE